MLVLYKNPNHGSSYPTTPVTASLPPPTRPQNPCLLQSGHGERRRANGARRGALDVGERRESCPRGQTGLVDRAHPLLPPRTTPRNTPPSTFPLLFRFLVGRLSDPAVSPASGDYRRLCSQFSRLGLFRPSPLLLPLPPRHARAPLPTVLLVRLSPPRSPTCCPAPSSASLDPVLLDGPRLGPLPILEGRGPGEERRAQSLLFERAEGSAAAEARREGTKGRKRSPQRKRSERMASRRDRKESRATRRTTTRAAEEEEDESSGGGGGRERREERCWRWRCGRWWWSGTGGDEAKWRRRSRRGGGDQVGRGRG
uniref:Uncharacterized protein n=1 Tax=Ananas comosus var. bracteatus TaxID=296719 RepID=A0A6V7PXL9_ANACO|nr:unnamed protein product [Ananas comosus var. bracteatus]